MEQDHKEKGLSGEALDIKEYRQLIMYTVKRVKAVAEVYIS